MIMRGFVCSKEKENNSHDHLDCLHDSHTSPSRVTLNPTTSHLTLTLHSHNPTTSHLTFTPHSHNPTTSHLTFTPHSHTSLSQPNHTSHLCKQPQLEDQTGYRHDDTHNGKQEAIIIHLDEPISRPVQTWVERQYITTGATINTIYGKTFECFTFTIFQVYMKSITFFHLTSQYIHNSL